MAYSKRRIIKQRRTSTKYGGSRKKQSKSKSKLKKKCINIEKLIIIINIHPINLQ
jgi:hypothetical protein